MGRAKAFASVHSERDAHIEHIKHIGHICHIVRIGRLSAALGRRKGPKRPDCLLITNLSNVRYLCGFTGSSGYILLTPSGAFFVTDFRYGEQASIEVRGCEVLIESRPPHKSLRGLMDRLSLRRVGVERTLECGFFDDAGGTRAGLVLAGAMVERLRETKDEIELGLIREAVQRAEAAFKKIRPHLKAGASEEAIAWRLESALRAEGCGKAPFEIIVASGPNSSKPHARPTSRRFAPGDIVVIDWGGEAHGYFSDMTRTFLVGGSGGTGLAKKRRIYEIVREANRKAVKAARAGIGLKELDAIARGHIARAGYAERFGHSLGHGVGLEVHESPRVAAHSRGKARGGMVFTIEPGIYLPGIGGVRIEDMVYIGSGKAAEVLTALPTELEII